MDFSLANLCPGKDTEVTIFPDDPTRSATASLASRWKKPIARVHVLEGGLTELARLVGACGADSVILCSLSSVSVIEPEALRDLAARAGEQVVKVSIGRTPIEMYVMSRDRCSMLLAAAIQRGSGAAALRGFGAGAVPRGPGAGGERGVDAPARRGFDAATLRAGFFEGVLHASIDLIEDLPGELLFQNDLMEYFESNMWVVSNCENERYHRIVSRLPPLAERTAESHIAEKGTIRNSWLGSGVEVEGVVEDSIIFANVTVKRNTVVSRSVVLNGNRIGTGTEIHNSLILPFTTEVPRTAPNIGDNCTIGAKSSVMRNADFPTQIRGGVTLIGTNSDIPNGFHAEAASYVAPGVSPTVLKRMKVLRKGTSILDSRPAEVDAAGGNGRHAR